MFQSPLSFLCRNSIAVSLILMGLSAIRLSQAETKVLDWNQFLGPQRNGVSQETELLEKWPAEGPPVVWKVPGGAGMSGLALRQDRVITLVQKDAKQWLVAVNAQNGQPLWSTAVAPEYRNSMGDGPRGTPVIQGERVYAFTGQGILVAVNVRDGKLLWSHDTLNELSGKEAEYGMACSPLLTQDAVIVTTGAPQATLVAYDQKTGSLRWKVGNDPAGYSSPALLQIGDRPQVVAFTGNSAVGIAPDSGKLLWRYPFETNYECNIATPILVGQDLLLSAGENHGSVLLKLVPRNNEFQVQTVWESLGPESVLRSEWQTPVLIDGYLYGMDNVGGAGPITHLTCVEASTGKRMWQKTRFGKGNLIGADGKLFISTMKGELVVVRASPESYQEVGRATVCGTTRQAPALAGGKLYLRDSEQILCIDVRRK